MSADGASIKLPVITPKPLPLTIPNIISANAATKPIILAKSKIFHP
jgi:hypothetical protein